MSDETGKKEGEEFISNDELAELRKGAVEAASGVTKAAMATAGGAAEGAVRAAWKPILAFCILGTCVIGVVATGIILVARLVFGQ